MQPPIKRWQPIKWDKALPKLWKESISRFFYSLKLKPASEDAGRQQRLIILEQTAPQTGGHDLFVVTTNISFSFILTLPFGIIVLLPRIINTTNILGNDTSDNVLLYNLCSLSIVTSFKQLVTKMLQQEAIEFLLQCWEMEGDSLVAQMYLRELEPVSYTHLDVYKRQVCRQWACLV